MSEAEGRRHEQEARAKLAGYCERADATARAQDPRYHTELCNERRVDAFCDDVPDPGCTCHGDAIIAALTEED